MRIQEVVGLIGSLSLVVQPVLVSAQGVQDAIPIISQRLDRLEQRAARGEEENQVLKNLLKEMLARSDRDSRISEYSGPEGRERAKQAAPAVIESVDKAVAQIKQMPADRLGFDESGQSVQKQVFECVDSLKQKAAAINVTQPVPETSVAQMMAACPESKARRVLDELDRQRSRMLETWNQCREAVISAGAIGPGGLPTDPTNTTGSSRKILDDNLKKLKERGEQLRPCAETLEKTAQELKDAQSSSQAMAMAMNMVATVCMASGGNPYVCGGAFILAALMALFGDGGGGGGGGDGVGDGPDNKAGPKGRGTGQGGDEVRGKPAERVLPASNSRGNWGMDTDGQLECAVAGKALTCWHRNNPNRRVTVDPDKTYRNNPDLNNKFAQRVTREDSDTLLLCVGQLPMQVIKGVVVIDENRFYLLGVDPDPLDDTRTMIRYPSGSDPYVPGQRKGLCDRFKSPT